MFSIFQKPDNILKLQKTETYSRDNQNKIDDSLEDSILEDKQELQLDGGDHTKRNMQQKQKKQLYYQHALEVLQTHDSPIKGPLRTQDSEEEAELLKEKKEDPELVFQEALKNYSITHKTNFSEMFHVVHKDEFEMLKIYTDNHPLLQIRKKILWVMKFISYLCFKFIKSKPFENAVLCIILFNTAVLMMVDPTVSTQTPLQDQFDSFFLIAYTVEMSFKILGLGFVLNKGSYLRDGWNILDFIIVVSSLLPLILGGNKSINLTSLRSLRILRPLRTISSIRALQVILASLFSAIPFLIDTFIVLFFYFFVFAIAGLQLFKGVLKQRCLDPTNGINYFQGDEEFMCGGAQDCNPGPGGTSGTNYGNGTFVCAKMLKNPYHGQNFDNIFYSLLLTYQSATLEGWSNTMYWIAQTVSVYTFAYHLVLVFVGANVIINLTLAVISAKYSESQAKAHEDKKVDLRLGEMDQDELEQKRIEDEEKKKLEESSSSDSDEEIIPSLEIIKKYSREERLRVRDEKQISEDIKFLKAGQSTDLQFIYDELMALKQQNKEDDVVLAQQAKQQHILDQYMDDQKNQMRIIFKKSAKKKANKAKPHASSRIIKIESSKKVIQPKVSPKAPGSYSDRKTYQQKFLVRGNSFDPDLPIVRSGKRDATIQVPKDEVLVRKNDVYLNDHSRRSLLLPPHKQVTRIETEELTQIVQSAPKLLRSDKRKSTKRDKSEKQNSSNNKEEFDFILQDLDDLQPLDEIIPQTKASRYVQQKQKLMLRGIKVKFDNKEMKPCSQSQGITMMEPVADQYSEILSNSDNEENNKDLVHKAILGSTKLIKLIVPITEDDSDDLFDDPDFRSDEQNKDHALAHAIFQQRYNTQSILKKKEQPTRIKRLSKGNPKIRGFLIHGLQEHLKKLPRQSLVKDHKDDNQMQQMLALIQHTNDDNQDQNNMNGDSPKGKSKKKFKKEGKSQDYKLVLTIDHEYFSSSKNDVMEKILIKKEKERNEALLREIKAKHYTFFYAVYEEKPVFKKQQDLPKQKRKVQNESLNQNEDSIKELYKNSQHGSLTSFNHLHGSTMGMNDNHYKEGSQTMQHTALPVFVNTVRVPVTKGGQIRRIQYQKIRTQNRIDDNIDQLLQLDKSLNKSISDKTNFNRTLGQSSYHKSTTMKKKRGFNVIKELFDLNTYPSARKAFNEPFIETILPFELPTDKLYLQILQSDFTSQIKMALHWSGEQVMFTTQIPPKRANKIRQKLDSSNQNRIIYLAGVKGFLMVRHNELQEFIKGKFVSNFLLLVVIGNTVLLSLAGTFTSVSDLDLLETWNSIFTYIFISEMGIKLIAFGPAEYLRDRMNIFDGSIVLLSIMEMTLLTGAKGKAVSAFRAIRIFRVLRITRLLRSMKFMGIIVKVVNNTIENFIYICFLMFLFAIIYSLLGMQIYGGRMGYRGNTLPQNWDNFLYAFLAAFQVITIENWDDLLQITLQSSTNKFLSVTYLVTQVILGNYVFLNLFIAVLMNGFGSALDDGGVVEEVSGTNEDEDFIKVLSNALLDSNNDLAQQKKENEYQVELEKTKIGNEFNPATQNISLQTSIIEDEVELDQFMQTNKVHKPLYNGIECESSLFMFDKNSPVRIFCYRLATNHYFEQLILGFIVVSSFKLAVDTYLDPNSQVGDFSAKIDIGINAVFICEATLKIIGFGFFIDENSYLTESWSQLDFFIVFTSLVDMLFSNVNIPVIKILRLLRILRPLRFISHNLNLKTIVIALFESLGGMLNVTIVVGLIWLMFAILGISLLGGKFGTCTVQGNLNTPNFGINYNQCISVVGNQWLFYLPNMDNIYNAMTMVFILTTLEGWPNILYPAMNGDTSDKGPSLNVNQLVSLYFVVVILASAFILINLFSGVVCYYFAEASKNEKKRGNIFLTQEQENWIEIQNMTIGVEAGQSKKKPSNKIRAAFFWLVEQGKFDGFIMICICLNILTMAMDYDGSTIAYVAILDDLNLAFTSVFISEATSKLIAFGLNDYLSSGWNKFDLFVVTTSILDISLNLAGGSAISFLRVGPQLIRIVRVLRVTRLLKLIKSMKSLQKLLQTLLHSLPALLNISSLTFLVFFIFSILGVFLFQTQVHHDLIISYNNFDNLGLAMMTLYRASTGENWEWVMYDYTPNQVFAPIYFMIFLVVSTWVMMNLFALVITDYFENYSMKADNPLEVFTDNLELFRKTWLQFTQHSNGEKLHQRHIMSFFQALPHPIGFFEKDIKRPALAKEIMSMQLIGDGLGNVYFNELLYAGIKMAFGKKIFGKAKNDLNLELQLYLIKVEQETRNVIEINKNKELKKKKFKYLPSKKTPINPLVTLLFNQMVFLSWKNYSILKLSGDQTPSASSDEEDSEIQNTELEENQTDNNEFENNEPSMNRDQQDDDNRIEEMEDDYSPSMKRPMNLTLKLDGAKYASLKRPNHIASPLNSIPHSGAQLRQGESSRSLSFQEENGRIQSLILPQCESQLQPQRIITNQNDGEAGLLELTQKQN